MMRLVFVAQAFYSSSDDLLAQAEAVYRRVSMVLIPASSAALSSAPSRPISQ
jgi:hypothetical protein